jgi:hypothetical protein
LEKGWVNGAGSEVADAAGGGAMGDV